jgi:type I restriction enzyme S subunit
MLIEVTSKIGDGLHGTPNYDDKGDYYFINGNNLFQGKVVIKEETKKVNKSEFEKHKKNLSDKTILLGINGTIGNVALYNNENCILGKSACYINVNENIHRSYLYYNLLNKDFQIFIEGIATGTTIPNVPLKGLREYQLLLPPLPEQKSIAEVLSSLDDKIDLLHRNNKTLEDLAEALFRKWFVEEAKNDWEEVKLGSVVQTILGGTPSTEKKEYWNGTIAWVNSGEVNKDRIMKPTKFITELGLKNSNTKLLPKKSTVMAITGATMGQVSYLEIETCANQSVVGIIPNGLFYPEFLHLLVKNNVELMIQNETGGAQPHINKNDINNILIKVPSKEILNSTKEKFENLYNKISNNCWQIQQLETVRDSLLPKLMSGMVRIKE